MNKLTSLAAMSFILVAATIALPGCSAPVDEQDQASAELGAASVRLVEETHELHFPGKGLYFVELAYLRVTTGDPSVDQTVNRKLKEAAMDQLASAKDTTGAVFTDWRVEQRVSFNRDGLLSVVETIELVTDGTRWTSTMNFDLTRARGTLEPALSALLNREGTALARERCGCWVAPHDQSTDDWALEATGFRFYDWNNGRPRTVLVPYKALAGTYLDGRLKRLAGESGAR